MADVVILRRDVIINTYLKGVTIELRIVYYELKLIGRRD